MPPELLAFCGVAAVLVVTPGPDMALVARNALVAGRAAVPITVLGICAGIVVHAMAAAIGLSALLRASATGYAMVKVAGGAFLIYLGIQAWRASRRDQDEGDWMLGPARRFAGGGAFRQGFITNVLNPKLVVFFITVLPAFASPDGSFFAQVVILASIHLALTLVWLLAYGNAIARVGEVMRTPRVRYFLERLSGTILIALGLRVATDGAGEL